MRARFLVVLAIVGCTNTQSQPGEEPPPPPAALKRTVEPAPTPKPDPAPIAKVDLSLGGGLEMRRPIHDGRLTLIPIVATRELPAQKFITLQDGMARGLVTVTELGYDWEVDTVRITNRSQEPLVVLSGEVILDAMQDRVTAENMVIMAGKTQHVNVRCVEEDRDHGGTVFHASNAMAELSLRRTVMHEDQENVWARVKQINRRDGLSPSTNTYRHAAHLQTKGANENRRRALVEQLENLEERNHIVGLAVAIDNEVIAIDRFATPELYRQLEGQLVASYLPATTGNRPEGKKLAPEEVRTLSRTNAFMTAATFSVLRPL